MITFLRKLFIKNHTNINDYHVRKNHGILASIGGIVINLFLFAVKLTIGLLTFSMSIISDSINNLTDLFSCFVNLFGFQIASKPADCEHPYGHQRVEYISGLIVSFIIIVVAVILGYSSITLLMEKQTNRVDFTNAIWAFIILGISILFKLLLSYFYFGLGKAIKSVTLKATMLDSLNDVVCSLAVLIAMIIQYFYPTFWWLDLVMSIVVALFIFGSGIKMIVETSSPLIGLPPDNFLTQNIIEDIKRHPEVLGVHDLVAHSYGPTKIFITIHVEVDGYSNMLVTHDVIDQIEEQISAKYGVEITIHMDPVDTKNPELPILKEQITAILNSIDSRLSFHDLRIIVKGNRKKILFDMVVYNSKTMNLKEIKKEVIMKVNALNENYSCRIRIDIQYLS